MRKSWFAASALFATVAALGAVSVSPACAGQLGRGSASQADFTLTAHLQ